MAYREVTVIEIEEVLRQWIAGVPIKRIARRVGLDPKTVRRYAKAAASCGLAPDQGVAALTAERVTEVVTRLSTAPERERGDAWALCVEQRDFIDTKLRSRVRLSKVRRLLTRQGVEIPPATLYRFAASELGFGRTRTTMPVADGEPGEEIYLDTGWMTLLEPDARGRRRRFRAWIFTPGVSRYRFVYPCFAETTATAIEACEAAWRFYGGVFKVVIPDNTKTIVTRADPLKPQIAIGFLEYAQARGFAIDPTRVRRPTDKARVERTVPYVREDCFGGETLRSLDEARVRAVVWSHDEAGMRRHARTQRLPREHFDAEERAVLQPVPIEPYDVPLWSDPKVARDQHAQVRKALYSLPVHLVGRTLRARADRSTVRFYDGAQIVKTHPRKPRGGRSTDPADFPAERSAYALRDVAFLEREAQRHGEQIGRYARALLDVPLPWTRMRRVYALLGLVKRYGAERVEETCRIALEVDLLDVTRLRRMLALATSEPPKPPPGRVIAIARFLRPATDYALQRPLPLVPADGGGER